MTQPSSEARHFCQKFNWCVLVPEHEGACSSYAITKQTIAEPSAAPASPLKNGVNENPSCTCGHTRFWHANFGKDACGECFCKTFVDICAAPASPTPPQKEYFATGYSREDLSAMHPDIELTPDPAYKKCPQCKRENTFVTWEKFGGKCPNCGDLFDKDRAASASTESPKPLSATTKVNDSNGLEPFWWEKSATPFDLARGLAFRTFPAENGIWPTGFGPNALADYALMFCESVAVEPAPRPPLEKSDSNSLTLDSDDPMGALAKCPTCNGYHAGGCHKAAPRPPVQNAKEEIMDDQNRGLYRKYTVTRLTNPEKHKDCRYYVLDLSHDKFSGAALRAYADACESEYPLLAADLRKEATVTP